MLEYCQTEDQLDMGTFLKTHGQTGVAGRPTHHRKRAGCLVQERLKGLLDAKLGMPPPRLVVELRSGTPS